MRTYSDEGLNLVEVLKQPRNKFYDIIDKGLFVVIAMIFLSLFFFEYFSDLIIDVFSILFSLYFLIYIFYVQIGNIFRRENIAYNIIGKLHFKDDSIMVLNNRIDLFEIDSIEISSFDFEGKSRFTNNLYFPTVSLGINNSLTICFKNGVVERYQFKLIYETQLYTFRKELVHYYKLGLIRELNLHDILGNQSFESKSDFRKHNPKYNA